MDYKAKVLSLIPVGIENAISRQDLVNLTGINDRQIRLIIKELANDYDIISLSGQSGYWISNDDMEIKKFLLESDNRRTKEYLNTDPIRRRFYARQGTRTVHVKSHERRLPKQEKDCRQLTL